MKPAHFLLIDLTRLLNRLDDIPKVKWPSRLQEFMTWIDVQMLRPGSSVQSVLREFSS